MIAWIETWLRIEIDGTFTTREWVIVGLLGLLALLIVVWISARIISGKKARKNSIFMKKKNRYKSRLGKKNIKY
ncbi:MAG: hypothetical protein HFE73_04615 [Firmicutes bacterium]|nr:hypothetical protein [Bacillota bacterium]